MNYKTAILLVHQYPSKWRDLYRAIKELGFENITLTDSAQTVLDLLQLGGQGPSIVVCSDTIRQSTEYATNGVQFMASHIKEHHPNCKTIYYAGVPDKETMKLFNFEVAAKGRCSMERIIKKITACAQPIPQTA